MPETLSRNLGLGQATAVVVGGIIGVSIFFVPSAVADSTGHPLLTLAIWVLAGLLSAGAALSFAELSGAIPQTGGTYVQLRRAYGSELLGFCFVWMICFGYGPAAMAVVATMASSYLVPLFVLEGDAPPAVVRGTAVALIAVIAAINIISVRHSARMQAALTILKVAIFLAVVAIPYLVLTPHGGFGADRPFAQPEDFGKLVDSFIVCLFAYNGAIFVVQLAGEVRDPERNLPRAIALGIGAVLVLYTLINFTYLLFIPFESLRTSERIAGDLMGLALGPWGLIAVSWAIVASALGVLNAQLLGYPRIAFAAAREGVFITALAAVHPRLGTPWVAIAVVAICAALYALSGSYRDILAVVAFVNHAFITLAVAAVIVLRMREPDLARPYRVWGYPYTPGLFIAVSILYLVTLLVTKFSLVMIGIAVVAAGVPVYWWRNRIAVS